LATKPVGNSRRLKQGPGLCGKKKDLTRSEEISLAKPIPVEPDNLADTSGISQPVSGDGA
jgi:hypothetical protein